MQKRRTIFVGIFAACALLLTACAENEPEEYRPAAYGENNRCYYVDDEDEVEKLYQSGDCPRSWTPFLMPIIWHQTYYPYYSSPAYYNNYVPTSKRSTYRSKSRAFGQRYSTQISTLSKTATYVSNTGKTVKGDKVSTQMFGGGSRTSGGGSRTRKCSLSVVSTDVVSLPDTVTGGGGGSRGGSSGGSRTGGSSGGSKSGGTTKSGTKPKGC